MPIDLLRTFSRLKVKARDPRRVRPFIFFFMYFLRDKFFPQVSFCDGDPVKQNLAPLLQSSPMIKTVERGSFLSLDSQEALQQHVISITATNYVERASLLSRHMRTVSQHGHESRSLCTDHKCQVRTLSSVILVVSVVSALGAGGGFQSFVVSVSAT